MLYSRRVCSYAAGGWDGKTISHPTTATHVEIFRQFGGVT